jgi:homogentisate 1,2-dioxygenase
VTSIRKDRFGDLVMTLDNGQTWHQTEGGALQIKEGTAIVISRGVLGAYFLKAASGNRSIKVKRVE